MKSVYLLTGLPGTGKTSLIKQAAAGAGLTVGGFYTEEIREGGTRLGFRLVTLDGRTATLAHIDFDKRCRVGKYGVDVNSLESVGVPALRDAAARCGLVIVDEIGKMELFSDAFRETVLSVIDSGKRVLGTVMLKADPFADAIKSRDCVRVITLTRAEAGKAREDIRRWLQAEAAPAV